MIPFESVAKNRTPVDPGLIGTACAKYSVTAPSHSGGAFATASALVERIKAISYPLLLTVSSPVSSERQCPEVVRLIVGVADMLNRLWT
jgi:hypothetical protein